MIWCHSHSILEPWGRGLEIVASLLLTPPFAWVSGQALGGAARCMFSSIQAMALHGNRTGRPVEQETRGGELPSVDSFFVFFFFFLNE